MASKHPSPNSSLENHLTCSICMEAFQNPVTTACGHSFCRRCLDLSLSLHDPVCPLCKSHLNRTPQVNIVLRNVVEEMKKKKQEEEEEMRKKKQEEEEEMRKKKQEEEEEMRKKKQEEEEEMRKKALREFSGKPDEVPCDICIKPKMKAIKSCLVCLSSFCDDHINNHSSNKRFKGHKLVNPVDNLDERACLTHGRPLELYRRTQQKCICVLCLEEGEEGVVSTEDEWDNKKAKLKKSIEDLKEKIKERIKKVDEVNESLKSCKDQLESEWWDIESVFTAVMAIVEVAQDRALQPVQDRRKLLEKEAAELTEKLQTEKAQLEQTISELEEIIAFDDHILFLQRYPSLKEPGDIKDWTAVQLDTSVSFGSMKKITTTMMQQIQLELDKLSSIELQRLPKFTVDVRLDPNTSHRRLVLSKDLKEVIHGGTDQEVDDDSERFDIFGSVLGSEELSGGKSYWEVEVGNKGGWDLGVAAGKANRKGKLTMNPDTGYWAIVHYEEDKYAALTAPPVCLELKEKPQKVGVFVDYDEGLVSFYDVTAQRHIHSFSDHTFNEEIFPYFSPHVKNEKNTEPLIISSVKGSC